MRHPLAHRFIPAFHALDSRVLPASSLRASLMADGVLAIFGSETADVIQVSIRGASSAGRGNAGGFIQVNGLSQRFRAAKVQTLAVIAGGGDDVISIVNRGGRPISAWIDGGSGNDVINGGAGDDVLMGGPGRDVLIGKGGRNLLDGGEGLDVLDGRDEARSVPIPTVPPTPVPVVPPVVVTPPQVVTPPAPSDPTPIEQRLITLVNQERERAGLSPLVVESRLGVAARIQATNMARLRILDHELPGVAHPTLVSRAEAAGYRFSRLGENIAYNYPGADWVHLAFMNSPGHRANILNPNFTEIGVAVAFSATGEPYYAQAFGRPA